MTPSRPCGYNGGRRPSWSLGACPGMGRSHSASRFLEEPREWHPKPLILPPVFKPYETLFDCAGKRAELEELESRMAAPGFWNDQQRARDVIRRLNNRNIGKRSD